MNVAVLDRFSRTFCLLCIVLLGLFNQSMAGTQDRTLNLTPEERIWLDTNKDKILYAPNPNWPPGDYMENGEHKGIVSDYIKIFEKELGFTFKRVYYNDWESLYHGMMTGEFDLIGAIQKTKKRSKVFVFTKPFLVTRLAVLTRTNSPPLHSLDELNSMTLAGIKGYSSTEFVKSKYPEAKVIECEDDLTVLLKLSAGAVDGAVIDYMIASYLIDKYSITNLKYAKELDFRWDLRFAIKKETAQLRSILDKVLNTISEKEQKEIYHKWVGINLKKPSTFLERHRVIILATFTIILFLLFTVILFNRSLKNQVLTRTKELKENSEKLQENKEVLRAILDSAGDTIIVSDADTSQIIDINQRMTEMYGYARKEALEINFKKLELGEPPFSQAEMQEWFRKAREIGPQTFEWLSHHSDGHTFWVEVKINFAVIGGNNRFVIVVRDIAERKRIEDQLMKAQKLEALGVLAGGIAHDFNNILSPIIGYSEFLIEDLSPDSSEHQNAKEIFRAGKRGGDLVRQILAFSRQTEQEKVPIRIQSILAEVIKLVRSTIPVNISITQKIQNNCSLIQADPIQIHQIAMNLITNAYHAVQLKDGDISIELKEVEIASGQQLDIGIEPGRYALLSISDTGVGIDPAIMHKIFEPYFTTKEQGKGTGLGLALVYGIIKEHHGEIQVTSRFGEGTTFDVYLPIMAQADEPAPTEGKDSLPHGHEHILVVDDEKPIANLQKTMLEKLGYEVTMCQQSLEALKIFKANPGLFDLIISDMAMPHMTGDQLSSEISAIRPDIPIIICTGFSERFSQEDAAKIGVKCFLMKPILKTEMARMVRKVLDTAKENA